MELSTQEVFVLHVKNGYETRARHIERMLCKMNIKFEYILDGDMHTLCDDMINRYFTDPVMTGKYPHTSCSMKHLLAYRKITEREAKGALILEDDIVLHKKFIKYFNKSMEQLDKYSRTHLAEPVIISYEDTRLRFVPRSKREKDVVIYKGDRDRMAGAYYINNAAAKLIYGHAINQKFDRPIDLIHNKLLREHSLTYFWCQPCIATQGSHIRMFKSSININKNNIQYLKWTLCRTYKKLLYFLR